MGFCSLKAFYSYDMGMKQAVPICLSLILLAGCTTTKTANDQPGSSLPSSALSTERGERRPLGASANVLDADTSQAGGFYASSKADERALTVSDAKVVLSGATVTSAGEGSSALVVSGEHSEAILSDTRIDTTGNESAALVSDGATIRADNLQVSTKGEHSPAAIVRGTLMLSRSSLSAETSQALEITGPGLATLRETRISCGQGALSITRGTGNGTATLRVTGGTIEAASGTIFSVPDANAVITLEKIQITPASGHLIAIGGENTQASVSMTVTAGQLEGSIEVGAGSTLELTLQDGSTWTGMLLGPGTVRLRVDDNSSFAPDEGSVSPLS